VARSGCDTGYYSALIVATIGLLPFLVNLLDTSIRVSDRPVTIIP